MQNEDVQSGRREPAVGAVVVAGFWGHRACIASTLPAFLLAKVEEVGGGGLGHDADLMVGGGGALLKSIRQKYFILKNI